MTQDPQFDRLLNCFENVFPNLSRADIPTASPATVKEWDSIAQVTLLSAIGEQFDMDIDFEEFEGATSFPAILELIRTKSVNA
jgi:acyl carrier protein